MSLINVPLTNIFSGNALQCYVGIGNASDPLINEAEHSIGSAPHNSDEGFFMRECGERGSQVSNLKKKHVLFCL